MLDLIKNEPDVPFSNMQQINCRELIKVLTIEEYIAKMKRADKLDEFDYIKISENMSSVMKYVMSYFNEYLTMETCDVEEIKHRHAADKLEQEVSERFPNSKSFIVESYLSNKIRIDKLVDNWMKTLQYLELYYSEDDFASLADEYCNRTKIAGVDMQVYKDSIKILMAEIKAYNTDKLDFSDMIHLNNNIISWIKDTYHT